MTTCGSGRIATVTFAALASLGWGGGYTPAGARPRAGRAVREARRAQPLHRLHQRAPRQAHQDHPRQSTAAARDPVSRQPAAGRQAAQGRLAAGARRVQGGAVRRRAGRARASSGRRPTATRSWRRATTAWCASSAAWAGRQGRVDGRVREGAQPAVRHRVLSARAASRAGSTSPTPTRSCASLPERRHRGARPGRRWSCRGPRRRAAARRRPLDARHRVLAGRQADVRVGRLALERRRSGQRRRPRRTARRHPGVHARRQRRARLRHRHPQRRSASPSTRASGELWVSVNERDEPGRQPGPRLHHARQRGRLLRLALVLHRRQPGSAPRAASTPS